MHHNWTDHPDIQRILAYVEWYRRRHPDISVTPGRKSEGSCLAFGEFSNLVYRQLVATTNFCGAWLELESSAEVTAAVLRQIAQDISRFRRNGRIVSIPEWD